MLDNCEHLLDACATLGRRAAARSARGVRSSRPAARRWASRRARLPRAVALAARSRSGACRRRACRAYESVRLFIDRALLAPSGVRAHRPERAGGRVDLPPARRHPAGDRAGGGARAVAVRRADRRPARRPLPPADRRHRTALPRQQTLRALIDWSYDLLSAGEQRCCSGCRCSPAAGRRRRPRRVCAGDGIASGRGAGRAHRARRQEPGRCRSRAARHALPAAGDDAPICAATAAGSGRGRRDAGRHRDYFLALAEEAEPKLRGAEQAAWLRRLEAEHDNLRAALEWGLVDAKPSSGFRLCGALQQFWTTRGHVSEGRAWCARVLAQRGGRSRRGSARRRSMRRAPWLIFKVTIGPPGPSRGELGGSPGTGGSAGHRHFAQQSGRRGLDHGDRPAGERCTRRASRSSGNRRTVGYRHRDSADWDVAAEQGDYPAAKALFEESLAISGTGGSVQHRRVAERPGGRRPQPGRLPGRQGVVRGKLGDSSGTGDRFGIAYSLEGLAAVVASLRDSLRAARIWGATQRLRAEIGTPLPQVNGPAMTGA